MTSGEVLSPKSTGMSASLSRFMDLQASGGLRAAWGALRAWLPGFEKVFDLQKAGRALRQREEAWREFCQDRVLRIAVIGTFTTRPVADLLLPLCVAEGWWAEVYEGSYGSWETEPFDPESGLHAFKPDIVIAATQVMSLDVFPPAGSDDQEVARRLEHVLSGLRARWQAVQARHPGVRIIQHNFDLPPGLPMGRLEGRYAWTATRFVDALNLRLWEHEGREVRVLNLHQLSQDHGRTRWFEPRWYHHSKHGFDLQMTRHYGNALAGLLRAMLGRTRKCLVTDLDNTLWGGVIGDDGLSGIQLGNNSATGEAHAAFGRYLKTLKEQGVILAINSKNNEATAMEVLDKHPETPLRRQDFAAIRCNWEPKSANLAALARELNIGLESLVFVDDNPAECEEVRAALPEVTVVEMTGDPSGFPRLIEERHLFTPLDFTAEDAARAQSYQARQALADAAVDPGNLDAYLAGLGMEAVVKTVPSGDLPRAEQLLRKTNQFNLCGRVFEQAELEALKDHPDGVLLAAWLKDGHANHGLVSVLAAQRRGDALEVLNWVMSCRVFTRTLEQRMFDVLMSRARELGCARIRLTLVPTEKNGYVQPLPGKLGFAALQAGGMVYEMETASVTEPPSHVRLVEAF